MSPSVDMAKITLGAMSWHALTAPTAETIMIVRITVSPEGPKTAAAAVPATNVSPAMRRDRQHVEDGEVDQQVDRDDEQHAARPSREERPDRGP